MTDLPKKPERYPNGSVRRLDEVADSVDQIIDYLSDKEKCTCRCHSGSGAMYCVDCQSKHDCVALLEEASKGERKHTGMCNECMPPKPMNDHKYLSGVVIHERTDCPPDTLYMVNENLFDKLPPQQEESMGEWVEVEFKCNRCKKIERLPKEILEKKYKDQIWCDKCQAEYREWLMYPSKSEPQLKEESPKEDEIRKTLIEWMYKEDVYLSGRRKSEYYVEDLLNILNRTVVSKVKIKRYCENELSENTRDTNYSMGLRYGLKGILKDLGLEELC